MAKKLYEEANIQAIATALRNKCGTTCGYKTCDMAAAIETIQGNGGAYDIVITEDTSGIQHFAITDADGANPVVLKTKTITTNGTYNAADDEADGYSSVVINVETEPVQIEPVLESISITANGTYTPPEGTDGYNSIEVNVPSSGGGSSLLDDYSVAYTSSTGLIAKNASVTVSSLAWSAPSSGYRRYYLVQNTIPVGASIFDYITETTSSNGRYGMPIYHHLSTESSPETLTMDNIKSIYTSYNMIYKYSGVTYSRGSNVPTDLALILYDKDGICLFNGTVSSGVAALNNKEIDISNGVFMTATELWSGTTTTGPLKFIFT